MKDLYIRAYEEVLCEENLDEETLDKLSVSEKKRIFDLIVEKTDEYISSQIDAVMLMKDDTGEDAFIEVLEREIVKAEKAFEPDSDVDCRVRKK